MSKLLILGGTGFVGRNCVEKFRHSDQFKITATYHSSQPPNIDGVVWKRCDLTKIEEVQNIIEGHEFLIQAAATTSGIKDAVNRPEYHVTDNAIMNSLIFREAMRKAVKHVIFFSCTTMLTSSDIPQNEKSFDANSEIFPSYFGVGWTKVYLEKMCEFYSMNSETRFTAIRHSNVYGEWDKFGLENSHVFGATITKVLSAIDSLTIWGNGKEQRDLLYVGDLVELVGLILEKQTTPFQLVNCGGNNLISIRHLVELISNIANKKLSVEYDSTKPTVNFSVTLNNSLAEELFGWRPSTPIALGIQKTIDHWNTNR